MGEGYYLTIIFILSYNKVLQYPTSMKMQSKADSQGIVNCRRNCRNYRTYNRFYNKVLQYPTPLHVIATRIHKNLQESRRVGWGRSKSRFGLHFHWSWGEMWEGYYLTIIFILSYNKVLQYPTPLMGKWEMGEWGNTYVVGYCTYCRFYNSLSSLSLRMDWNNRKNNKVGIGFLVAPLFTLQKV